MLVTNNRQREQIEGLQERFEGVDPEEYRRLLGVKAQLEGMAP